MFSDAFSFPYSIGEPGDILMSYGSGKSRWVNKYYNPLFEVFVSIVKMKFAIERKEKIQKSFVKNLPK
jgi:hypothetical protein